MQRVLSQYLERDLELLGVTGVEDKLQKDVKPSLELLRNAGIKIWMLTGDKVETARCVAVSSKLVARGQYIYTVAKLKRSNEAQDHLDFLRNKPDSCLLVDGESLALFLARFGVEFVSVAVTLPTVVACRCSPTQKAEMARLIKDYTKKRVCCIGDGGNDVSMIQAADVGVGIVGKEGRQASLAADFSIEQFHHLTKLLVWHGRNSYKRSAKLAQFVIHRGLIIAVCQTMYSIALKFEPEGLYKDWLMVGLRHRLHGPAGVVARARQGRRREPGQPVPGAVQGADVGPVAVAPHLLRLGPRVHLPGQRHPGPVADPDRGRRQAHGGRQLHRPGPQRAAHGGHRDHHLAPRHDHLHRRHLPVVCGLDPLPGRLLRPRLHHHAVSFFFLSSLLISELTGFQGLCLARAGHRGHFLDTAVRGEAHPADDEAAVVQEGPEHMTRFSVRIILGGIRGIGRLLFGVGGLRSDGDAPQIM